MILLSRSFWIDLMYTFIPIFVALDVGGVIPIYLSLTKDLSDEERRQVSLQALFTALCLSALFIVVGQLIFHVLGITTADFEIAGGILLLVLAIVEMLDLGSGKRSPGAQVGPVPLGTPLIAGPAVLTSLIILVDLRGVWITFAALLINLGLVSVCFQQGKRIARGVGVNGLRVTSQVISLFLAAIAVSMIHRGFVSFR